MGMNMSEVWAYMGSLLGLLAFGQTLVYAILPVELRVMLTDMVVRVADCLSAYAFVDIPEYDGTTCNELYGAARLHLSRVSSSSARRVHLTRAPHTGALTYRAADRERVSESFAGATFWWEHQATPRGSAAVAAHWLSSTAGGATDENRAYVLRVRKCDRAHALVPYLDHITAHAKEIRLRSRDRLLYTNSKGLASWDSRSQPWESVPFRHPSTFDTLAIDPARKQRIANDLASFATGERFYRSTGRAWKRGYLLYGPPGTGKSSLIAAMANHLGYDVYDLELTEVNTNAELRKLLVRTTNKSIIVIEDIDCSLNLTNTRGRRTKKLDLHSPLGPSVSPLGKPDEPNNSSLTLSGLLNFTDGLWSCCGSERIFVFTTNHIERLDPALLRSGRMDMHIHMSFCSFPAFKILAKNYLGIDIDINNTDNDADTDKGIVGRDMFLEVERIIDGAHMTPADVSEILIRNKGDPKAALEELLTEMREANQKPWPSRKDEGSVEDAEEEKRALEEEEKPWKADLTSDCGDKCEEEVPKDSQLAEQKVNEDYVEKPEKPLLTSLATLVRHGA